MKNLIYAAVSLAVLAFGLWYAKDPTPLLERKYAPDKVPENVVRIAKLVGKLIALGGAVATVVNIFCIFRA